MSSLLHNLQECLRLIVSDKLTERKKQIEELPFILSNRDVLEALDKNGYRKDRITWKRVFKSIRICVQKEIECIEKEFQKGTGTSATRERKRRAVTSLVRLVIRQSISRSEPKLATDAIVEHILMIMRSEFAWNLLATDYSNILLKEVLAHRRVSRDISPAALGVYTSYYRTLEDLARHDLIMKVLVAVIRLSYFQTIIDDTSHLFVFFKDVILKSRCGLMSSQQENLLSTCLTFCKAVAIDCRIQLCHFGECVFHVILSMLVDNITKNFKSILIEFLQLQMACHHPGGATSEVDGMWSGDSVLWRRSLHSLYLILIKELEQPAFRSRYSTKKLGLESDFLELLIDVFNVEVFLERFEVEEGDRTKRRRTVRGFPFLLETIQNVGAETEDVVAWLQLVSGCLSKFPDTTASLQELVLAAEILHQLQVGCKRYTIMSALLHCLRQVFGAYRCLSFGKFCQDSRVLWNNIYELTVRAVSLNHCVKEGHKLLAVLVGSKVVEAGPELSRFFTPAATAASSWSLQTLVAVLDRGGWMRLNRNRRLRNDVNSTEIHFRLLDWLLPNAYDEDNALPAFKTCGDGQLIELHAQVLCALAVDVGIESLQNLHAKYHEVPPSLDDVYLQASCCRRDTVAQSAKCLTVYSSSLKRFNCKGPAVRARLLEFLLRDCCSLLECETQNTVAVSVQCCLVVRCIGYLVYANALMPEDLIDSALLNKLKNLMARVGDLLHDMCDGELYSVTKEQVLNAVVANLQMLYSWNGHREFRQTMSHFCRDITSEKLLDVFFDYLFAMIFKKSLGASAAAATMVSDADPNFHCLKSSDTTNGSENKVADCYSTFHPIVKPKRYFGADSHRYCPIEWSLSDNDKLRLDVARLLVTVGANSTGDAKHESMGPTSVLSRLLGYLRNKDFDLEVPFNVHLTLTVLQECAVPFNVCSGKSFDELLMILREVCKVHSKDGEVSAACLLVLANLIPRLNELYVARDYDDELLLIRDHVLRLLNAFCICRSHGNCGPYAELGIVRVLTALAGCDRRFLRTESASAAALVVDTYPKPSSSLPNFLKSKSFVVALESGKSFGLLFNINAESHEDIFESILTVIGGNAAVASDSSPEQCDRQVNWTSSCVGALVSVAIANSYYVKPVLYALCMHAKDVHMSLPVIDRALDTIASHLAYPSTKWFVDSHIVYLVDRYMREDIDLELCVWPPLTLRRTFKDFCKTHHLKIVPTLFARSRWERYEAVVCAALDCSPADIVTACFAGIMTAVFLGYAAKSKQAAAAARSCHNLIKAVLTKPLLDLQIACKFEEIVVSLLRCVHVHHIGDAVAQLPPSNPPAHPLDVVDAALTCLMRSCDDRSASLVSVLCSKSDGVQKVLLALETNLADDSHEAHDVYQAMAAYGHFIVMVWLEFKRNDAKSSLMAIRQFVVHDVVTALLHQLERCDAVSSPKSTTWNAVAAQCCSLLENIARSAVDDAVCTDEFAKLLPLVVDGLLIRIASDPTDTNPAVGLVNYMIVESCDQLSNAIGNLEPLPDLRVLATARAKQAHFRKKGDGPLRLEKEIERFLHSLESSNGGLGCRRHRRRRPEGLRWLRQRLANPAAADQLRPLMRRLQGLQFADDCADNVVYRLLVELVHLCCDVDLGEESDDVIVEAARCLGELGPMPMSAAVLQASKTRNVALVEALQHFPDDPAAQRCCLVFHRLWSYLSDPSVRVKAVSSTVLKNTLATTAGHAFVVRYKSVVKSLSPLFSYLHPFVSNINKDDIGATAAMATAGRRRRFTLGSGDVRLESVDATQLWRPEGLHFEAYIVKLCIMLIDSGVHGCEILLHLQPICASKVDFCVDLFPYVIHAMLESADRDGNRHCFQIFSRQIDAFFETFVANCEQSSSSRPQPICSDTRALNVLLNTILFLRLQKRPKAARSRGKAISAATTTSTSTPWEENYRLDLDYLRVARAAHHCAANFSALLFVETWYEVNVRMATRSSPVQSQDDSWASGMTTTTTSSSSNCGDDIETMRRLLMSIYRDIGDPDAIYACGGVTSPLLDADVRLQYYEHERQWDRALFVYDESMRLPSTTAAATISVATGMPRTLQKLGLRYLTNIYFESASYRDVSATATAVTEFQLECAWKTTSWNDLESDLVCDNRLLESGDGDDGGRGIHELIYCSLSALRHNDRTRSARTCSRAFSVVAADLRRDGAIECLAGLERRLACLYVLANLEDIYGDSGSMSATNLLTKWSARDSTVDRPGDVMDQVLSVRNAVLQILNVTSDREDDVIVYSKALVKCEERQAALARTNGLFQLAETYISRLRKRSATAAEANTKELNSWKLEEARIFWGAKEHDAAKSLLTIVIDDLQRQGEDDSELYARALGLMGNWSIETHSENASVIMEKYLEKSIALLERHGCRTNAEATDSLINGYVTAARYADAQYTRIVDYLKSGDYERKQRMAIGSKEEARRLKVSGRKLSKEQMRSYIILTRQSEIDRKELESMRDDRFRFLVTAAHNYAKCLALGTSEDTRVFRLISLWFCNRKVAPLNATIKDLIVKVPSHKFLPLVYQLAARLGSSGSDFRSILQTMIERMTADHPHHTLPVILALRNATNDDDYLSEVAAAAVTAGSSKRRSKKPEETDRAAAARDLLNRVQPKGRIRSLLADNERLCDALIAFSYCKSGNYAVMTEQQIDRDQPLMKLGRLKGLPPLTLTVPVDPTCAYDDVPGTIQYLNKFNFCGGVNHPKRIRCLSTDGIVHTQLVKGNDDLRQDAVMQQVFVHVNRLLRKNAETARRNLSIRTYKVVPLTQRSGVLEWCVNTMPLKEYLVDSPLNKGAHSRYHPDDLAVSACLEMISVASSENFRKKYDAYLRVCQRLRPVFRHFFFENFPEAPIWYERRMAYVRSVATNSIIGYVLGLGDRHVSNILVDKRSAELVHIDLGIAFEQGRILPTPETVPFRLTRDVVDGMGINGTEGPFRRCCEKTMEVMRSSHEVVLTILEVLLYDPLYQWSLTPLKACKIQDGRDHVSSVADTTNIRNTAAAAAEDYGDASITPSEQHYEPSTSTTVEDINKLAERALCRLGEKLHGIEGGGTALSVSGQVSWLLREAMDPCNLCKLYKGWQAYL